MQGDLGVGYRYNKKINELNQMVNDVARLQPHLTALYSAGSELITHGRLRAEVYFRTTVFPLESPLRENMEDILLLVNHLEKVAILQHAESKR